MKLVKLAAAVLNQTPMAWDNNQANIVAAIDEARRQQASIVCLPELCISGYGCEDAFHSPALRQTAWHVLQEILPHTRGLVVSLGLPILFNNAQFNAACLAVDGKILGFVAKRYLAGDGIHYEPRWFKAWPAGKRAELRIDGRSYPLGDIYFDCGGVKVGFEICEDAWVADRPGSELALRGVDVILNPSASHFAFGKIEVRRRFVLEGSRAFGVSYVYSNLLGNESGRAIYDGGTLIASAGKLLAAGPRFSYADWQVTSAVIDVDATRMTQARTGSFRPSFEPDTAACIYEPFEYPPRLPEESQVELPAWEHSPHIKEEEFARAIPLALFDYLRKSRSHGFVVSLSGGADSSAVSSLVWLLVQLGIAELGVDRFLTKLNYIPRLRGLQRSEDVVRQLLTCVYQSTRNSGPVTFNAASSLAQAVNAQFLHLEVDGVVQNYLQLVEQGLGRKLSWQTDDVALQNIQARVRSPGVWMIANLQQALLLSTSNRSEAAVGYATMDGDTSGGLSPIAGIDKDFLRRWLRWLQQTGPNGLQPIAALAAVNVQAPTAELRPQESGQTDEADLMPYDLLDFVERAAIRDRHSPLETYLLARAHFTVYDRNQLLAWVERFFLLWCRNQWKRERYAPSFHVDDQNLDPKTWCRFPILSGGFQRELAELRAYVRSNDQSLSV